MRLLRLNSCEKVIFYYNSRREEIMKKGSPVFIVSSYEIYVAVPWRNVISLAVLAPRMAHNNCIIRSYGDDCSREFCTPDANRP